MLEMVEMVAAVHGGLQCCCLACADVCMQVSLNDEADLGNQPRQAACMSREEVVRDLEALMLIFGRMVTLDSWQLPSQDASHLCHAPTRRSACSKQGSQ